MTMLRNPIINIGGVDVLNIGDPHLGKKFSSAFPDRRNDISEKNWEIFEFFIVHETTPLKVVCGDIFDKSKVDEADLLRAANILRSSKHKIIVLEGNHDSSKTSLEKTSFDVLVELLTGCEHIRFIRGVETIHIGTELVTFIGWEYHNSIQEQIEKYMPSNVKYVYTHVDFESFGSDKSNCIPFSLLEKYGVKYVVNGHEHLPKRITVGSIDYIGTGSMLPHDRSQQHDSDKETYADLFINVYADDVDTAINFTDKFVYYHSNDFSDIPEFKDAYGVILKKVNADQETETSVLIEFDEISIPVLLHKSAEITGLAESEVNKLIQEFVEVENE